MGGGRNGVELASCFPKRVALFNLMFVTLHSWPLLLCHCSSCSEPNLYLPAAFPPPNLDSCCLLSLKYLRYLMYVIMSIFKTQCEGPFSLKPDCPSRNNSHPLLAHITHLPQKLTVFTAVFVNHVCVRTLMCLFLWSRHLWHLCPLMPRAGSGPYQEFKTHCLS